MRLRDIGPNAAVEAVGLADTGRGAAPAEAVDVEALAVRREACRLRQVLQHRVQVLRRKLHILNPAAAAADQVRMWRHIRVKALENGSSATRPRSVIVRSVLYAVARPMVGKWRRTDSKTS